MHSVTDGPVYVIGRCTGLLAVLLALVMILPAGVAMAHPRSLLDRVIAVAASSHNLALRADGTVVAWGSGYLGDDGDPNEIRTTPVRVLAPRP
ncbi:hypothetical protein Vqi01_25560 [Micromonospora qiuiae]|uniref:Regulator of chromosome condensation (RCC1) repeat-containing protein n=1 Tax=Micromonospora qiuiae TaxID=502268 RepID=A0ABQ4JB52_9ACTN|nr:RCC1 domain-containing protein [Micromonospora qiuiae]GIJ27394.1 hypothetical protein Vqi01_25560 [Micromonospora qiuiae]